MCEAGAGLCGVDADASQDALLTCREGESRLPMEALFPRDGEELSLRSREVGRFFALKGWKSLVFLPLLFFAFGSPSASGSCTSIEGSESLTFGAAGRIPAVSLRVYCSFICSTKLRISEDPLPVCVYSCGDVLKVLVCEGRALPSEG